MRDLIFRFLQSSQIDPIYFVTSIVDLISFFLLTRLKRGLSVTQRSFYTAIIVVGTLLTAATLCKIFGLINDWKELETIWSS